MAIHFGVRGPGHLSRLPTAPGSGAALPVNTVAPVVSGGTQVGVTLTTTNGAWTNTPTSYAYQWQRGGVNIGGATAVTYKLVTADASTNITCVVTATNAAGSASATSNAVAVSALTASPFADDFTGAGNLSARAPTPNGGTAWTVNPEGGIVGNMVTTAAGYLQGAQGSGSNWIAANGYDGKGSASAAGHLYFEFAINPTLRALDANIFCPLLFVTRNGANDYSRLEINWTTQAVNKNAPYQLLAKTSGTTQTAGTFVTSSNANRVTIYGGDVLGQEVTSAHKISLYISGWKVLDQLDISANLSLWPENMGFSNRSAVGVPSSPVMPDGVMYGDADNDGMLRLISPSHVAAKTLWGAATDSCRFRLVGEWFGATAPAAINVRIWDATNDLALSGYNDVPALGLTTTAASGGSPGTFSCYIDVVASGRPDFMQPQVRRTDLTGGAVVWHKGAVKGAGLIVADYNQSRGTRFWQNIATYTMPTLPANSWTADGSTDNTGGFPVTKLNSRIHPCDGTGSGVLPNAKSHVMKGFAALAALSGHTHYCYIRAGQGGTDMTQRRVGGSGGIYSANQIFQRLLDGIDHAGDLNVLWLHDEAFEVTNGATFWANFGQTESQTWKGYVDTLVSTIEAYVGHSIVCILSIGPSIQATGATSDARAHQVNRAKAELVSTNGGFGAPGVGNPQRYYAGANEVNAKKISAAEVYHLDESLAGSGDLLCQEAPLLYKLESGSGTTQYGPTINSVSRLSGTQVRVLYDLNGCSDLELLNAAAAGTAIGGSFASGDFRYGQWFNSASTFAGGTELIPTAATKNAASGGQCSVDYTFASVPATSYFRGPYGQNPFNRTNNATIAGDPQNQSAMLRGVYAGSNFNCLLRPYFNLANSTAGDASLDYLTVT